MNLMKKLKRISALIIVFTFIAFSTNALAEDAMQTTMRNALYGGIVGALVGSAILLLTDNPDDHLSYIPVGAAVGVLGGVAYGIASSGMIRTAGAEIEDGKVTFNLPTVSTERIYDEVANAYEEIEKVDLIRVKF